MAETQPLDISQLSPQQLDQLRQQLDEEIQYLTGSLQQLKGAQGKYVQSTESLNSITKSNEGKQVLVPLSSTLYAPGILDETEKVIVDVGTGYYIEKTVEGAKDFFARRMEYVKEKIEQVQPIVMQKMKQKSMVEEMLQTIVAQMQQAQAAAQKKKK